MNSQAAKLISRKVEFKAYRTLETFVVQPKSLRHEGYATPMTREVVVMGRAASAILYIPETDELLMNEQFRIGAYILGEENPFLLECCAGAVDAGEEPVDAARREALEETGAEVLDIEFFGRMYTSCGVLAEEFHMFAARIAPPATGFYGVEGEGEEIKTHLIPYAEILRMLDAGEILNGPTVLMLNWFARHRDRLRKKWGFDT